MSSIPDDLIEDAQIALSEFRDVLGGCFEDAVDTVSRALFAEREAQRERDAMIAERLAHIEAAAGEPDERKRMLFASFDSAATDRALAIAANIRKDAA